MKRRGSFSCPNCGEEVPAGAKACPGCGADENTGWSENAAYDGVDLPDENEFDYQKFLEREGMAPPKRSPRRLAVLLVTALLLLAFALIYLLLR